MWQLAKLKFLMLATMMIAAFIAGVVTRDSWNYQASLAYAQESETNFKSLLMRLSSEMGISKNILVTFYFINPIGDDLIKLTVPRFNDDVRVSAIKEVGDDYLCIGDGLVGNEINTCIPFTNIASILYISPE